MRHILIAILISPILIASSVVGSWQIDKGYTRSHNSKKYKDILNMTMEVISILDISKKHEVVARNIGLHAKLQKSEKHFNLVSKGSSLPLYLLDNRHIKLIQTAPDGSKYSMYYNRISSNYKKEVTFKSNKLGLKLNRVYRSKKIDHEYRFLLLSKKGKFFFVQTDRTSHLTSKEVRSKNILKILRKKSTQGSSFVDSDRFVVKKRKIYTLIGRKRIRVINSKRVKYYNVVYKLQKD